MSTFSFSYNLCKPSVIKRNYTVEDELAEKPIEVCDSTSDCSDEADGHVGEERIEKDRQFMEMAQEYARKSEDKKTKVFFLAVCTCIRTVLF